VPIHSPPNAQFFFNYLIVVQNREILGTVMKVWDKNKLYSLDILLDEIYLGLL
jgi:hypothetical protein